MLTIDQIKSAHSKVKSGADFPAYIQELKQLGVTYYETFVGDGHTDYHSANAHQLSAPAKYEILQIAAEPQIAKFMTGLKEHQQGRSDYPAFCKISAETGVEKWVVNVAEMTCTYYDLAGKEMLVETIPMP